MNTKKKTFLNWYNSLPANEQPKKRETIMFLLKIERSQFYNILKGKRLLNPAEAQAINSLAGSTLIFEDKNDDVLINLNLVKA